MMAASLPFSSSACPLSGLELDAWYEDLQDILFSDTKNAGLLQTDTDKQDVQVEDLDSSAYLWTLDSVSQSIPVSFTEEDVAALEAVVQQLPSEVLEFLNPASQNDFAIPPASSQTNSQNDSAAEVDSGCSSPQSQTHTEDEESSGSQSGTKRKRTSQPHGGKVRAKERDQENEKQVAHLMAENERLKGEIDRLTLEVEQTRKDLIERMVNLKKA
ncbi:DNA damage-inducible transcript 3 protein [Hyperolius riggenbachi]|uniref:DNA damage-inducible transcript 3 protein n=1 Tax=Hyperolius riggenbachi TaxID=752182 RepID=UPI0035A2877E